MISVELNAIIDDDEVVEVLWVDVAEGLDDADEGLDEVAHLGQDLDVMLHTIDEVDDDEAYELVRITTIVDERDANELWLLDIKQMGVVEYLQIQLDELNTLVEIIQFIVSVLYEVIHLTLYSYRDRFTQDWTFTIVS